jgi:hypothetical protein
VTDLQGAWVFDALVLTVTAVLDAVLMSFALHAALARARREAPEVAGGRMIAMWAPSIALWLGLSIALALRATPRACSSGDAAMLYAGLFYPLAAWPAPALARRAAVPLPRWYLAIQAAIALLLLLVGGVPCL